MLVIFGDTVYSGTPNLYQHEMRYRGPLKRRTCSPGPHRFSHAVRQAAPNSLKVSGLHILHRLRLSYRISKNRDSEVVKLGQRIWSVAGGLINFPYRQMRFQQWKCKESNYEQNKQCLRSFQRPRFQCHAYYTCSIEWFYTGVCAMLHSIMKIRRALLPSWIGQRRLDLEIRFLLGTKRWLVKI